MKNFLLLITFLLVGVVAFAQGSNQTTKADSNSPEYAKKKQALVQKYGDDYYKHAEELNQGKPAISNAVVPAPILVQDKESDADRAAQKMNANAKTDAPAKLSKDALYKKYGTDMNNHLDELDGYVPPKK